MARKSKAAPDPKWDHVFKSNYTTACFWDVKWLDVVDDLIESAGMLEPQVRKFFQQLPLLAHAKDSPVQLISQGILSVHFMLVSYAIENLFKAHLVRTHGKKYTRNFESKQNFPRELCTHDLVELARLTDFTIDLGREDLFRRLTRSAEWQGRYPVPLDYHEMSGSEIFKDGNIYSMDQFGGNDLDRLTTLVHDIRAELDLKSRRISRHGSQRR